MAVDWTTAIATGRDLITGIAAGVAALVAAIGLSTWRTQLKGKTEYELARRTLRSVYRVRDEISRVRGPFISSGEVGVALTEAGIKDPKAPDGDRTAGAVYAKRWRGLTEAMSELEAESLEAEVLWGEEARAVQRGLRSCVGELYAAVTQHVRYEGSGRTWANLSPASLQRIDRVLYQTSTDPEKDPFTGSVQQAVERAEAVLRPHLRL